MSETSQDSGRVVSSDEAAEDGEDDFEPPHQMRNLFLLALAFGITFAAQSGPSVNRNYTSHSRC